MRKALNAFLISTIICSAVLSGTGAEKEAPKPKVKAARKEKTPKKEKFEILFDGKTTDKWHGYKRQDFPAKEWSVEDGALKTNPKGDPVDIVTKGKYDNFDLQFEWKVAPGANSGVMYHANEDFEEAWNTGPEYQVLDDSKHPDGKNPKTSAAALYALIAPQDKELKPVGEWNEGRILVNGKHVEHYLNGRKVVEYELGSPDLEQLISKSKFASMPKFAKLETGSIVLQHHHDEVWYRNIKVRRLSAPPAPKKQLKPKE
jgi:hypothetical protein